MNASGPDIAAIQCYQPDGCCGPSPCAITEDQFICQIRSLLPEGDLYNNTLPSEPPASDISGIGSVTVGCYIVGCEQLVVGGCCDTGGVGCDVVVTAPQLAVVDSFAAAAYGAVQALCNMLKELDPCTADLTMRQWALRLGIITDDPCEPQWSDDVLALLICLLPQIKHHVINLEFLTALAARFGATFNVYHAGDFNCGPTGWWTMARDRAECPPAYTCPPGDDTALKSPNGIVVPLVPPCVAAPPSMNLVLCPSDVTIPANCNIPGTPMTLPHDPELYAAFKWLLPQILPQPIFWCIYECDEANCIV